MTPEINQSSLGEYGKCSSPVCLSVRLVGVPYGLSVKGLRVVVVISLLIL